MKIYNTKGFVLLYAVLLVSIVLTISLSLYDISYRQIILSSTVESAQLAFYATDGVRDCIRYYDSLYAPIKYSQAQIIAGNTWRYFGKVNSSYDDFEIGPDPSLDFEGVHYELDCGANVYDDNDYYDDSNSNERISTLDFDFGNGTVVNVVVTKKVNQPAPPFPDPPRPVWQEFTVTGTHGAGTPRQVQTTVRSVSQ